MSLSNPRSLPSVPLPTTALNAYLWWALKDIDPALDNMYRVNGQRLGPMGPIFPYSDSAAASIPWGDKPYLLYDRVPGRPTNPFYPIKRDVYHFSLKADATQALEWVGAIQQILDRQDDAAKDVNNFNFYHPDGQRVPVFFHHLRVYQIDPAAETKHLNDSDQFTDIMVVAEYHFC